MTFTVRPFEALPVAAWRGIRDAIDFNPPYQRRSGVWTARVQAFLIDSILNGYDLPKFYIADFSAHHSPLNVGKKQFAIVDGKQRLEAIYNFYDGELSLAKDFVFLEDPALNLAGLTYQDLHRLHPRIAGRFDNYVPSFMAIITDDEARINDLFVRLNQSRSLTGAEVRNAMPGAVPEHVRQLAEHDFFVSRVRFSVKRGADRNTAAKLLLMEFRGRLVDTKKVHLDSFARTALEQAEAGSVDLTRAVRRVRRNLNLLCQTFSPRDWLLSNQGAVPVYYWLVRNNADMAGPVLRAFLAQFETERHANRELARQVGSGGDLDAELLVFDNLNRNTNDAGSLEGRYRILLARHRRFTSWQRSAASGALSE